MEEADTINTIVFGGLTAVLAYSVKLARVVNGKIGKYERRRG